MILVGEVLASAIRNRPELLAEYADEASVPAIGRPAPQWEMYAAMEAAGVLQVFGVFADGQMVGFATVIAAVSPHYGVKLATLESLFVCKAWRGTRAGAWLLRAAKHYAMDGGCKALGRWRHGRSVWTALTSSSPRLP